MKCPLLSMYYTSGAKAGVGQALDCLKEECAWWVSQGEEEGHCAIFLIAIELDHLNADDLTGNLTSGLDEIAANILGISKKKERVK